MARTPRQPSPSTTYYHSLSRCSRSSEVYVHRGCTVSTLSRNTSISTLHLQSVIMSRRSLCDSALCPGFGTFNPASIDREITIENGLQNIYMVRQVEKSKSLCISRRGVYRETRYKTLARFRHRAVVLPTPALGTEGRASAWNYRHSECVLPRLCTRLGRVNFNPACVALSRVCDAARAP